MYHFHAAECVLMDLSLTKAKRPSIIDHRSSCENKPGPDSLIVWHGALEVVCFIVSRLDSCPICRRFPSSDHGLITHTIPAFVPHREQLPAIVPALTLGRWFLDNWSKRPSLSGQELRDKLFETAASISRDESVRDLVSEGEGDDTAFVAALRASLERSTANQVRACFFKILCAVAVI